MKKSRITLPVAVLVFIAYEAAAAGFVVTTTSDLPDLTPGDGLCETSEMLPGPVAACSFRAAVEESNALAGDDVIDLPSGTFELPNGRIEVTDSTEIRGAGLTATVLDGLHQSSVMFVRAGPGIAVLVEDLNVRRGGAPPSDPGNTGFAIGCGGPFGFNPPADGALTLRRLRIEDSSLAVVGNPGNGFCGSLTIEDSLLIENGDAFLSAADGPLFVTIKRTRFESNSGKSIFAVAFEGGGVVFDLVDSHFVGNGTCGGATGIVTPTIWLAEDTGATIDRVVIEDNCGVGIRFGEQTVGIISNTRISGNQGTGIVVEPAFPPPSVEVRDSVISGNTSSTDGGGVYSAGWEAPIFRNVTISGNSAPRGGGIFFPRFVADLVFENSSIIGNAAAEGGGLYISDGSGLCTGGCGGTNQIVLNGSVVAENTATTGADCFLDDPTFFPLLVGSNLIGILDGCGLTAGQAGLLSGTTASPLSPLLGPLADNGGATESHLPLQGSPLIDATPLGDPCTLTDQRGGQRPADGDGDGVALCDIGAIEIPEPSVAMMLSLGAAILAGSKRGRLEKRRAHQS